MERSTGSVELSLANYRFWRAHEGNEDGLLPAIVAELLSKGADVNAVGDFQQQTALHHAVTYRAGIEVLRLLLEPKGAFLGADICAVDEQKRTVLHLAAKQNKTGPKVMAFLLNAGRLNVNAVDSLEKTALHYAAKWKAPPEVVKLLLEHGADVDAVDTEQRTALQLASEYTAPFEVMELLLGKGVRVHGMGDKGKGAHPHFATTGRVDTEIVALLIENGVDLDAVDKDKYPALFGTVDESAEPHADNLLGDKDSWASISSAEPMSAVHTRGKRSQLAAVTATRRIAADATACLVNSRFWIDNGNGKNDGRLLKKAKELLDQGADIHASGFMGRNALHWAVRYNPEREVVSLLLDKGIGVHAVDMVKMTALHHATMERASSEVVKLLVERGADVNAVDEDQCTALHYAVRYQAPTEVVRLLLDKGADVHSTNRYAWTALQCAAENQAPPVMLGFLLVEGAETRKSSGEPILLRNQDAEARQAANEYMCANESFFKCIGPDDTKRLDAYIAALASAEDDHEACPNKVRRLAEARTLRDHSVTIPAASKTLKFATALAGMAMEDAILADAEFADVASTLEVAVGTGAAVMRELEPSPLAEEFCRLVDERGKPLLARVIFRTATAPLNAAIASRDKAALRAAVTAAETDRRLDESPNLAGKLRRLVEDVAKPLLHLLAPANEKKRDLPHEKRNPPHESIVRDVEEALVVKIVEAMPQKVEMQQEEQEEDPINHDPKDDTEASLKLKEQLEEVSRKLAMSDSQKSQLQEKLQATELELKAVRKKLMASESEA